MAKGIASKNSLKALAHPIEQFLAAWGARERPSAAKEVGISSALPAPYELAALRGEGVLRQRFFGQFMERLPFSLDAAKQITAWQTLVEDGGHITSWVQRLGIAKALRREALMAQSTNQESRKLYTLLLDALNTQAPELLPWAVEAYFWHCWKQQFPDTSSPERKGKASNVEVLRERLLRALRKRHGQGVEIKESFTQSSGVVRFGLLWRHGLNSPWQKFIEEVERPRLKPARLSAYSYAINQMDERKAENKKDQ